MSERKKTDICLHCVYFQTFPSDYGVGPALTIRRLANNLSGCVDVEILSIDYDVSTGKKYSEEEKRTAGAATSAKTTYIGGLVRRYMELLKIVFDERGVLLVHCLYDYRLAIPAMVINLTLRPTRKFLHMPHGIFMDVIQEKNPIRKKMMRWILGLRFVAERIVHVVSSERERADAIRNIGLQAKTVTISHFYESEKLEFESGCKVAGALNVVWVGRIAEQKNLKYALEILKTAGPGIKLHVFGAVTEERYYKECLDKIAEYGLEDNITFYGYLPREELLRKISVFDLFFSPTKGENFGQGIIEALQVGLPVLISSETPWNDIEKAGAGWAFSLNSKESFAAILKTSRDMGGPDWAQMRKNAQKYGDKTALNSDIRVQWLNLLKSLK